MQKFRKYINNESLADIYPHATKWQMFRYRWGMLFARFIKWSIGTGAIASLTYAGFMLGSVTYPVTVYAEKEVDTSLVEKIKELKVELLTTLKGCEAQGYKEADAPIIFDSNNKASIGLYQWQINSVIHYYKVLYGKDISRKEAVEIALDEAKAGELAAGVIFTTKNGVAKDWVNCDRKHNLSGSLAVIKKLEK
jgi:hypothetical protein